MIYLIDDDDVYQYTFVKALEEFVSRDSIKLFGDGEQALSFIEKNLSDSELLPDVVFLDINMPLMDGWEFMDCFSKLKSSLPKSTRVYMVSSSIDSTDVDRARSLKDVNDYLIKPISLVDLETIVSDE